jgi:hypothetical protein
MGNLGYPAKVDEIRKFGAAARKVFIHKPTPELQKTFTVTTMSWEEDKLAKRPWARRGEEEVPRTKRQQGMGAAGGGARNPGWEDRGGGGNHRQDDPRGGIVRCRVTPTWSWW